MSSCRGSKRLAPAAATARQGMAAANATLDEDISPPEHDLRRRVLFATQERFRACHRDETLVFDSDHRHRSPNALPASRAGPELDYSQSADYPPTKDRVQSPAPSTPPSYDSGYGSESRYNSTSGFSEDDTTNTSSECHPPEDASQWRPPTPISSTGYAGFIGSPEIIGRDQATLPEPYDNMDLSVPGLVAVGTDALVGGSVPSPRVGAFRTGHSHLHQDFFLPSQTPPSTVQSAGLSRMASPSSPEWSQGENTEEVQAMHYYEFCRPTFACAEDLRSHTPLANQNDFGMGPPYLNPCMGHQYRSLSLDGNAPSNGMQSTYQLRSLEQTQLGLLRPLCDDTLGPQISCNLWPLREADSTADLEDLCRNGEDPSLPSQSVMNDLPQDSHCGTLFGHETPVYADSDQPRQENEAMTGSSHESDPSRFHANGTFERQGPMSVIETPPGMAVHPCVSGEVLTNSWADDRNAQGRMALQQDTSTRTLSPSPARVPYLDTTLSVDELCSTTHHSAHSILEAVPLECNFRKLRYSEVRLNHIPQLQLVTPDGSSHGPFTGDAACRTPPETPPKDHRRLHDDTKRQRSRSPFANTMTLDVPILTPTSMTRESPSSYDFLYVLVDHKAENNVHSPAVQTGSQENVEGREQEKATKSSSSLAGDTELAKSDDTYEGTGSMSVTCAGELASVTSHPAPAKLNSGTDSDTVTRGRSASMLSTPTVAGTSPSPSPSPSATALPVEKAPNKVEKWIENEDTLTGGTFEIGARADTPSSSPNLPSESSLTQTLRDRVNDFFNRVEADLTQQATAENYTDDRCTRTLENIFYMLSEDQAVTVEHVTRLTHGAAVQCGLRIEVSAIHAWICDLGFTSGTQLDADAFIGLVRAIYDGIREVDDTDLEFACFIAHLHSSFPLDEVSTVISSESSTSWGFTSFAASEGSASPSKSRSTSAAQQAPAGASSRAAGDRGTQKRSSSNNDDFENGPSKRIHVEHDEKTAGHRVTEQLPCIFHTTSGCCGRDPYISDMLRKLEKHGHSSTFICGECYSKFADKSQHTQHICEKYCVFTDCPHNLGRAAVSAASIRELRHKLTSVCPSSKGRSRDRWRFVYALCDSTCVNVPEPDIKNGTNASHTPQGSRPNRVARMHTQQSLIQRLAECQRLLRETATQVDTLTREKGEILHDKTKVESERDILNHRAMALGHLLRQCLEQGGDRITPETKLFAQSLLRPPATNSINNKATTQPYEPATPGSATYNYTMPSLNLMSSSPPMSQMAQNEAPSAMLSSSTGDYNMSDLNNTLQQSNPEWFELYDAAGQQPDLE